MFGYDWFAIREGHKIVAEKRGGLYLIGLQVYAPHDKGKLQATFKKDYDEEVTRRKNKEGEWTEFPSLRAYEKEAEADVLFYFTPLNGYVLKPRRNLIPYLFEAWKKLGIKEGA